jgi:hypothetical protein
MIADSRVKDELIYASTCDLQVLCRTRNCFVAVFCFNWNGCNSLDLHPNVCNLEPASCLWKLQILSDGAPNQEIFVSNETVTEQTHWSEWKVDVFSLNSVHQFLAQILNSATSHGHWPAISTERAGWRLNLTECRSPSGELHLWNSRRLTPAGTERLKVKKTNNYPTFSRLVLLPLTISRGNQRSETSVSGPTIGPDHSRSMASCFQPQAIHGELGDARFPAVGWWSRGGDTALRCHGKAGRALASAADGRVGGRAHPDLLVLKSTLPDVGGLLDVLHPSHNKYNSRTEHANQREV